MRSITAICFILIFSNGAFAGEHTPRRARPPPLTSEGCCVNLRFARQRLTTDIAVLKQKNRGLQQDIRNMLAVLNEVNTYQDRNWQHLSRWIDEVTLKTGPPGAPGDRGTPGFKGNTGLPGQNGEPGCRGPQGETGHSGGAGLPGNHGAIGGVGLRGQPGLDGRPCEVPGPRGDAGYTGSTGPVGPPGPPGPFGLTGKTGVKGPAGGQGNPGQCLPRHTCHKKDDYHDPKYPPAHYPKPGQPSPHYPGPGPHQPPPHYPGPNPLPPPPQYSYADNRDLERPDDDNGYPTLYHESAADGESALASYIASQNQLPNVGYDAIDEQSVEQTY
uniref:Uncharacterized protein n=1 Tax=Plectus sambesii TaxID=2011161 RepID=A0A914WJH6_9BILA